MNVSIIRYILGHIIKLEGFFMLLPCVFALIFHEKELFTYLAVAVGCILLGSLLTLKKAKDTVFYLKEGCIIAMRHIHMSPQDAKAAGVSDGEIVSVKAGNERGTVFLPGQSGQHHQERIPVKASGLSLGPGKHRRFLYRTWLYADAEAFC